MFTNDQRPNSYSCKGLTLFDQAAHVRGARTIIAVDRVKSRLDLARELGATHTIDTSNLPSLTTDLVAAIKEIVPRGTNANFETTGVVPIVDAGVRSLHLKGQMILISILNGKTMELDLGFLMAVRRTNHPKKLTDVL